jgi:hypothetical protein
MGNCHFMISNILFFDILLVKGWNKYLVNKNRPPVFCVNIYIYLEPVNDINRDNNIDAKEGILLCHQ